MNAKRFSKKLLSLFLAILMALTCFTSVITAFGAQKADADYHDGSLSSNILAWAETTDDQTCTAILDYADQILAGVNYHLYFKQNIVIDTIKIDAQIDSVDGILDVLTQASAIVEKYKGTIGADVKNIDLTSAAGMTREKNTSKQIVMAIAGLLYKHSNDFGGKNVLKQFLTGNLDLGIVGNFFDLYKTLGGAIGFTDTSYKSNLVYNVVHKLFVDGFYKDSTSAKYEEAQSMKIDDLAFQLLDEFLFDTLKDRDKVAFMKDFTLSPTDNANTKILEAFKLLWSHTIEYLMGTINYDKFGFDDTYYKYCANNSLTVDYSTDSINAWIANDATNIKDLHKDSYTSYMEKNPNASLTDYVKDYLTFDRTTIGTEKNQWKNIDGTNLFNKVLYSPLANALGVKTGVLNLMIKDTNGGKGHFALNFDFTGYTSVSSLINDFVIELLYQFFPTLKAANLGFATSKATDSYKNLVPNALILLQWVADNTDKNILNGFYTKEGNSTDTLLSEANIEDAMYPLLTSVVSSLGATKQIHDSEWNACNSAEDVAFVCLKEYLAYVLPDKDYSVLPGATITDGYYNATLEGTILPLVRDALAYVIGSSVPIVKADGEKYYDVYTANVNSDITIWNIFNNVLCYYAQDKGVGNLLGFVSYKGKEITRANDFWANLDIIVNSAIPQLSALISTNSADIDNGTEGAIKTKDLIYDGIVKGILNIADTKTFNGESLGGISHFVNVVGYAMEKSKIFNEKAIINIVYDFIADMANFVLGARDSGDSLGNVVPETTSATPFDDLLQVGVIAGTSSNNDANLGVLSKAIARLYWALGGESHTDTAWKGAMFAVTAVNSFVPSFVPQLSKHSLGMGTASVSNQTTTSAAAGQAFSGNNLTFTNGSHGLNRFYKDIAGETQQLGRYYMHITNIGYEVSDGCANNISVATPSTNYIAPEESVTMGITGTIQGTGIITYTVTYDIVDKDYNSLGSDYTGLKAVAYQGVTTNNDWFSTVYNYNADNKDKPYHITDETNSADSITSNNYSKTTTAFGKSSWLNILLPTTMVLYTSNLSNVENCTVRVRNTSGFTGSDRSVDGVYCYSTDTVYDDISSAEKAMTKDNAIPCYDKATGDILNYKYLDYFDQNLNSGAGEWVRGEYTEATIQDLSKNDATKNITNTRTHIVYTLDEALAANIIAAYHKNTNTGVYEYMYLQTGGGTINYDSLLSKISCATNVNGIYIKMGKTTQSKSSSTYVDFLGYDGTTQLSSSDSADLNICFYNSNSSATTKLPVLVADDKDNEALTTEYKNALDYSSRYKAEDFTGTQYTDLVDGLKKSITAQLNIVNATADKAGTILSENASAVSSHKQTTAKYSTTNKEYGDVAYIPASESNHEGISAKVIGEAYKNADGYYFYDNKYTLPIYTKQPVTDPSQTSDSVMLLDDEKTYGDDADNKYHMVNAPLYKTEWDTTTYTAPYLKTTTTQETDNKGKKLYKKTQFVYRDASGSKVTSGGAWTAKFAETELTLIPNTDSTDNRGIYQQAYDRLVYDMEQCNSGVDSKVATSIRTLVTGVRDNLNNVNFDVVTYENMVKVAKEAESMYSYDPYNSYYNKSDVDSKGNPIEGAVPVFVCYASELQSKLDAMNVGVDEESDAYVTAKRYYGVEDKSKTKYTTTASSTQIKDAISLFNKFLNLVVERGYIGDKLESEIKCATGGLAYDAVTVNGENVEVASAKYGSVVDGVLTNKVDGKQAYTDESWNAYIKALIDAVDTAKLGEGDYAHATRAYYVPSEKDNYTADVSNNYTVRNALMCAENDLTPYVEESSDVTVTGTLKIMTSTAGALGAVAKGVGIYNANNELLGTAGADGTFSISIPASTASQVLTIKGDTTLDRTITVNSGTTALDAGTIGIICCDYNHDTVVNTLDLGQIMSNAGLKVTDSTYFQDFNGDGVINTLDIGAFLSIKGSKVVYSDITVE